jgi:hypothetical protein
MKPASIGPGPRSLEEACGRKGPCPSCHGEPTSIRGAHGALKLDPAKSQEHIAAGAEIRIKGRPRPCDWTRARSRWPTTNQHHEVNDARKAGKTPFAKKRAMGGASQVSPAPPPKRHAPGTQEEAKSSKLQGEPSWPTRAQEMLSGYMGCLHRA